MSHGVPCSIFGVFVYTKFYSSTLRNDFTVKMAEVEVEGVSEGELEDGEVLSSEDEGEGTEGGKEDGGGEDEGKCVSDSENPAVVGTKRPPPDTDCPSPKVRRQSHIWSHAALLAYLTRTGCENRSPVRTGPAGGRR